MFQRAVQALMPVDLPHISDDCELALYPSDRTQCCTPYLHLDTLGAYFKVSGVSLNLGPIWQASDSLSPRAPGSGALTFLTVAPEPFR